MRTRQPSMATRIGGLAAAVALLSMPFASAALAQAAATVHITDRLDPPTVTIAPGGSVTWQNDDQDRHRIRSTSGPAEFDSGNLEAGDRFSFVFSVEGTYHYHDDRNDDNTKYHGIVIVAGNVTGTPPPDPGPIPPPNPEPPPVIGGVAVDVVDRVFRPATITVAPGTLVTWRNIDDRPHTVTSTSGGFDSGIFGTGGSWSRTFADPGVYDYVCTLHPDMVGTVTVADSTGGGIPVPPDPPPPPEPGPVPAPPSPPPTSPGDIAIVDNSYSPANRTVTAGTTLVWSNTGALPHTVTSTGSFDSGILLPGSTYRRTFTTAGTFDYICTIHPEMTGTVTVTGTGEPSVPAVGPGPGDAGSAAVSPVAGAPAATAATPTGPTSVEMFDNGYRPSSRTVTAGSTITWSNNGDLPHTATARDGSFDSGFVMAGNRFQQAFPQVGAYDYFCSIHPEMTGTINVVEAGSTASVGESNKELVPDTPGANGAPAPFLDSVPQVDETAAAPAPQAGAAEAAVDVIDNDFKPKTLRITEGTSVRWTNTGKLPHTVTATNAGFGSSILSEGDQFVWMFDVAGTYDYICTLHPEMTGRIVVARPVVEVVAAAGVSASAAPPAGASLGAAIILATVVLAASIAFAGGMASFGRSAAASRTDQGPPG